MACFRPGINANRFAMEQGQNRAAPPGLQPWETMTVRAILAKWPASSLRAESVARHRPFLSDNLKTAVIERIGDAIRFNETFLRRADHYRFAPSPVAVARGNEKGWSSYRTSFARCGSGFLRTSRDGPSLPHVLGRRRVADHGDKARLVKVSPP